jgi:methylmalonyl-CoA/ethylmalonyl-CoA epimerase
MPDAHLGRLRLHHTGVVVADLADAEAKYRALGFTEGERISVPVQAIEAIVYPTGEGRYLELISPTDAEGPIAKYMSKRGEGVHHVAYQVDDIEAELARLKAAGVRLIDESPRIGAHVGWQIAFIHPESTNGVLTELVQVDGLASP